jgi:hypothetical protein
MGSKLLELYVYWIDDSESICLILLHFSHRLLSSPIDNLYPFRQNI